MQITKQSKISQHVSQCFTPEPKQSALQRQKFWHHNKLRNDIQGEFYFMALISWINIRFLHFSIWKLETIFPFSFFLFAVPLILSQHKVAAGISVDQHFHVHIQAFRLNKKACPAADHCEIDTVISLSYARLLQLHYLVDGHVFTTLWSNSITNWGSLSCNLSTLLAAKMYIILWLSFLVCFRISKKKPNT